MIGFNTSGTFSSLFLIFNSSGTFSSLVLIHPGFHLTQSEYLHLALSLIQLTWTHFLYLSILTLVSNSFLQSNGDISAQLMTSTGTDLALWLCKLLEVLQNNRLFFYYLFEQCYLLPNTYTQFVPLHRHDTLYSYSSNQSFHF